MTLKCNLPCKKSFKVLKFSCSQISQNRSCSSAEFMMVTYSLIFTGLRITGRAITGCPKTHHCRLSKRQSDTKEHQYLTIETSEVLFEHQKDEDPLVIKLAKSSFLIGPNYKLVVRDENQKKNVNQTGELPDCLFRGVVEGREDAQVAISTCGQTLVRLSLCFLIYHR